MNREAKKKLLRKDLSRIRDELNEIEKGERNVLNVDAAGKCFRFKNSYSLPSKPEDYWWLYVKVLRILEDESLEVLKFEKDSRGIITITPFVVKLDMKGYEEIPSAVLQDAWQILVEEINLLTITSLSKEKKQNNVKESCKLCDHKKGTEQWCFMHKVAPEKRCFHHSNPVAALILSCKENSNMNPFTANKET